MDEEYLILENSMGDLRINSVADRGFYEEFNMSPELHVHSYYEILFSLCGSFLLNFSDGNKRELRGGDLCLIPPGVYHGTSACEDGSRKLALRFRYERATEEKSGESLYGLFHRTLSATEEVVCFFDEEEMSDCMERLRRELLSPGSATKAYVEALLSQFYLRLMRQLGERLGQAETDKQSGSYDERSQRQLLIEEYFQENFAQSITEDHLAAEMCLSRRQVSRVLREIYGKSFRQLLIEERLNRAAQLLLSTDRSVEQIAEEVGYTSLSGFYSAFRRTFGTTVGHYRRSFPK